MIRQKCKNYKNTKSKITTTTKKTSIKLLIKVQRKKNTNASKAKKDTKKTKNNVTAKKAKRLLVFLKMQV